MFSENVADLFTLDGFGQSATFNGTTAVKVIINKQSLSQFGTVMNRGTYAFVETAAAPAPVGKTLLLDGVTYTIRSAEIQDDGAITMLTLEA